MKRRKPFKECSLCRLCWPSRESFLSDPTVEIIGYMANFVDLRLGILEFNHATGACGTTLGIAAGEFADLYKGEIFRTRETGKEACSGYCLKSSELRPCPAKCECAYVREIIRLIRNWPKEKSLPQNSLRP